MVRKKIETILQPEFLQVIMGFFHGNLLWSYSGFQVGIVYHIMPVNHHMALYLL